MKNTNTKTKGELKELYVFEWKTALLYDPDVKIVR